MANATLSWTDLRTLKAAGIVERQEVVPVDDLPGFYRVCDTTTGSGQPYLSSSVTCDCADFRRRGRDCKHIIAVKRADNDLAQFCADWDTHSVQARAAAGPRCPTCGAQLTARQFFVGGRGYQSFLICVDDATHAARPA